MKLHPDELPREKLIKHGPQYLVDYELLAILLGTGTKNENVLELSKRITAQHPIKQLSTLSVPQLTKTLGIGQAKACTIAAISEVARRLGTPKVDTPTIKSAHDAIAIIQPKIAHLPVEQLLLICLNTRNKVITIQTITTGTLNSSLCSPREIIKIALEHNAAACILAHNHPSGDPTPSSEDIRVTQEIKQAANLMQTPLLDHIIVADNTYYSMKEQKEI